jgi:hypothetical protein
MSAAAGLIAKGAIAKGPPQPTRAAQCFVTPVNDQVS